MGYTVCTYVRSQQSAPGRSPWEGPRPCAQGRRAQIAAAMFRKRGPGVAVLPATVYTRCVASSDVRTMSSIPAPHCVRRFALWAACAWPHWPPAEKNNRRARIVGPAPACLEKWGENRSPRSGLVCLQPGDAVQVDRGAWSAFCAALVTGRAGPGRPHSPPRPPQRALCPRCLCALTTSASC